jgi:hypothetical protein
MAPGSVKVTLDDGESLTLEKEDLDSVYDALWSLADEPGAVTAAAMLMDTWRLHPLVRRPVPLTPSQSRAIRKAIARLGAGLQP